MLSQLNKVYFEKCTNSRSISKAIHTSSIHYLSKNIGLPLPTTDTYHCYNNRNLVSKMINYLLT